MRIILVTALAAQLISPAPKPGHATILPSPAEVNGTAGGKLSLFVDVAPKSGIHVYAPGSNDYIPITVKLNAQPAFKAGKVAYPKSEMMTFADEKVPVFQKPFRLTQDVTLDKSAKAGSTVTVSGTVSYQACDDRVCYPPESSPISWTVTVK
ncbi:MAG TPA: protein-disulfide reductase DsbD domain-containing protein [Vicinamibacterales bacterium]|nr:protein-disulfide reductase DsbD domain-containing protein [Vicinamibacterales bacterium]